MSIFAHKLVEFDESMCGLHRPKNNLNRKLQFLWDWLPNFGYHKLNDHERCFVIFAYKDYMTSVRAPLLAKYCGIMEQLDPPDIAPHNTFSMIIANFGHQVNCGG